MTSEQPIVIAHTDPPARAGGATRAIRSSVSLVVISEGVAVGRANLERYRCQRVERRYPEGGPA
jgi:hypothetical protein